MSVTCFLGENNENNYIMTKKENNYFSLINKNKTCCTTGNAKSVGFFKLTQHNRQLTMLRIK